MAATRVFSASSIGFEQVQEGLKLFRAGRMTHFAQGFSFDLTDTFSRDIEFHAHFFQRFWLAVKQSKTLNQHFAFAFGQGG